MSGMITLKVNGKEVTVKEGTLILDAAREAGFKIPTFCYQANLSGLGSCRMCLIGIEGQKKLQPACITPVLPNIEIKTESEEVLAVRASMLEFLLTNHALDCPVCDKAGECELQDMVHKHGPRKGRHEEKKIRFHEEDYAISQVIVKNSNRCVKCQRCVRTCEEVVGRGVLGSIGRGAHQEETSFMRTMLDCDNDGMCIEVCPVGCFMRRPYRYKARPWDLKSADTVCTYCATGCRLRVQERAGEVVRSIAKRDFGGFNGNMLCARGRFGYDILNSGERITSPLIKKDGKFEAVTWDEAIAAVREKLFGANPDRIGAVASAALSNEELFLFQRLFRDIIGTPNVDSGSRWRPELTASFADAAGLTLGGASVHDAANADTIFVIGQLSDENPVTEYIVRHVSASARRGVVIASPRGMKLDKDANVTVRHMPGRLGSLLFAVSLAVYEMEKGRLGSTRVAAFSGQGGKTVQTLASDAGVPEAEVKGIAARLHRSASVSLLAGTDMIRLGEGADALHMLRDVLSALGKKVIVMPLLDRANQRGAWDMGAHPLFGPGYSELKKTGLGCGAMLDKACAGGLDGLYVAGEDIVSLHARNTITAAALKNLKFLIVSEMFMTKTAAAADIVLPAAGFAEKEGTFTNQEGRVQRAARLKSPPGAAWADLKILSTLASLFDRTFEIKSADCVFSEIKKNIAMYDGVTPDGVAVAKSNGNGNGNGNGNDGGNSSKAFTRAASSKASTVGYEADIRIDFLEDKTYPYYLLTGNHLLASGTLTRRSAILKGLLPEPVVEISEAEAGRLGVSDGDKVKVSGVGHEAVFAVRTRRGTLDAVVFIPENFPEAPVNRFFRPGEAIPRVKITIASKK